MPLDEEYAAVGELKGLAFVYTSSKFEVVGRELHFLPGKQGVEVGVELMQVESIQRLVVVVAVGFARVSSRLTK